MALMAGQTFKSGISSAHTRYTVVILILASVAVSLAAVLETRAHRLLLEVEDPQDPQDKPAYSQLDMVKRLRGSIVKQNDKTNKSEEQQGTGEELLLTGEVIAISPLVGSEVSGVVNETERRRGGRARSKRVGKQKEGVLAKETGGSNKTIAVLKEGNNSSLGKDAAGAPPKEDPFSGVMGVLGKLKEQEAKDVAEGDEAESAKRHQAGQEALRLELRNGISASETEARPIVKAHGTGLREVLFTILLAGLGTAGFVNTKYGYLDFAFKGASGMKGNRSRAPLAAHRLLALASLGGVAVLLAAIEVVLLSSQINSQASQFEASLAAERASHTAAFTALLDKVNKGDMYLKRVKERRDKFEHRMHTAMKQAEIAQQTLAKERLQFDSVGGELSSFSFANATDDKTEVSARESRECPKLAKQRLDTVNRLKTLQGKAKVMQTEMERLLAAKSDKSRDSDDAVALLESQLTAATHEILSKGKQASFYMKHITTLMKGLPKSELPKWQSMVRSGADAENWYAEDDQVPTLQLVSTSEAERACKEAQAEIKPDCPPCEAPESGRQSLMSALASQGMSVGNQGALAALIQKWGPKPLGSSSVTSFGTGDEDTVDQEHSMQAAAGPQDSNAQTVATSLPSKSSSAARARAKHKGHSAGGDKEKEKRKGQLPGNAPPESSALASESAEVATNNAELQLDDLGSDLEDLGSSYGEIP